MTTPSQKGVRAHDQINDKGGLLDAWKDHEDRLRRLERFVALCVGGSAVATLVLTVLIQIAQHYLPAMLKGG